MHLSLRKLCMKKMRRRPDFQGNKMRRRQDLSKTIRRRPDFLIKSQWVLCPMCCPDGHCAVNDPWCSEVLLKLNRVRKVKRSPWFPPDWNRCRCYDLLHPRWRSGAIIFLKSLTWPKPPFCQFAQFCTRDAHHERISFQTCNSTVRSLYPEMSRWCRHDNATRLDADSEPWGLLCHWHPSAVRQLVQSIRIC